MDRALLDQYHDVYCVSDLHLGGPPGGRVFSQSTLLARLIREVGRRDKDRSLAFVFNGDTVDFLADTPGQLYLDDRGAAKRMDALMHDREFGQIFDALAALLRDRTNSRVIFMVGNHDVELGLPDVQAVISRKLSSRSASSRVVFATDGTGYLCQVGQRSVYAVHGEQFDVWNVVDYDRMRRIIQARRMGANLDQLGLTWIPNAGTMLVVNVINRIKHAHPFIELLKPEGLATYLLLRSMPKEVTEDLGELLAEVGRFLLRREITRFGGLMQRIRGDKLLSADPSAGASRDAAAALLGPLDDALVGAMDSHEITRYLIARELAQEESAGRERKAPRGALLDQNYLRWAEHKFREGALYTDRIDRAADRTLGLFSSMGEGIVRWALKSMTESARVADIGHPDETFAELDRLVHPDVGFLLAGHTHARRALRRRLGHGVYLNTGTWARLILPEVADFGDESGLSALIEKVSYRRLEELDGESTGGIVQNQPTVAHISEQSGSVIGGLYDVVPQGSGPEDPVELVPLPVPDMITQKERR